MSELTRPIRVNFKRLYPDSVMPVFALEPDQTVGLDFCARIVEGSLTVRPGDVVGVGLGVAWAPGPAPKGWKVGLIMKGRSGLAFTVALEASNAGVIDPNYRGEIKVLIRNNGRTPAIVKSGDRIAQGIVIMLPHIEIAEVRQLDDTRRGSDGFGSTGR